MLYTSRPLERVYANFNEKEKDKTKADGTKVEPEYKEVMLPNGRLVTRREGDNYIIERVQSTNMSDYLNLDMAPGKQFKI
ncbi:MAG: hypothetical protein GX288_04730 [Clostridiales bacterium]|jgi:hypothetical protein|nr:hypothetical protein [Clostridiales bacterium]